MSQLKTTTVPKIVETLGIMEKGIDEHIYKIPGSLSQNEIQKLHFDELIIFLSSNHQSNIEKYGTWNIFNHKVLVH